MIENIECMKDIITFVSENVRIVLDNKTQFHLETTSLLKIIENISKEKGYEKDVIIYNFLMCCKNKYIESNVYNNKLSEPTYFIDCIVSNITSKGLDFINQD